MNRNAKVVIALVIAIVIVVPAAYFGVEHFAAKQVQSAKFSVDSIQVKQISESGMNFTTTFEIQTNETASVSFDLSTLAMSYMGTRIGNISLQTDSFSSGSHVFTAVCNLTITDSSEYNQFLSDFINRKSVNVSIAGTVSFTGALSAIGSQNISRTVNINALNGLSFSINAVSVQNIAGNNMSVRATGNYDNPSSVSMNVKETTALIYYNNSAVGKAVLKNLNFSKGIRNFSLVANLSTSFLVPDFIQLNTLDFNIKTSISFNGKYSIPVLTSNLGVNGLDGLNYSISSIRVDSIQNASINVTVSGTYDNPSKVTVMNSDASFNIYYMNTKVANAVMHDFTFAKGIQQFEFPATITNPLIVDTFIQNSTLKLGFTTSISINGSTNVTLLNSSTSIAGLNGLDIAINSYSVQSVEGNVMNVLVSGTYYNPSNVVFKNASLNLLMRYGNASVGNASISDLNFRKGLQAINFNASISSQNLINNYVMDRDLNISFIANMSTNGKSWFPVLNSFLEIKGLNGLGFTLTSYSIQSIHNSVMQVRVIGTYDNPGNANFNNTMIHVLFNYGNSTIGNATLNHVSFSHGISTVDLIANLAAPSLTSDFIMDKYLNMSFVLNISTDGISWMNVMNSAFSLPGLNGLRPDVTGFNLTNANSTSLIFALSAAFDNPSSVTVNITGISVGILYEGKIIGNATLNTLQLLAGVNKVDLNATLNGNKAILSDILRNYIGGNNTLLGLNITASVQASSNSTALPIDTVTSVVIHGTGTPLIVVNAVTLSVSLSINFVPPGSATVKVYVNVTINNPLPFAITVNNYAGSIYYNDPDGYDFSWGVYSYSNSSPAYVSMGPLNLTTQAGNTPLLINGNSSVDEQLTLSPTISFDTGCRFYADYPTAYMDITGGKLALAIGGFGITVNHMNFTNVRVPISRTVA